MNRIRAVVIPLLVLVALVVAAQTLESHRQAARAAAAADALRRTHPPIGRLAFTAHVSWLMQLGTRLADGELAAILRAVAQHDAALRSTAAAVCRRDTGVVCDPDHPSFSAERARIAEERFGETVLGPFSETLARNVAASVSGADAATTATPREASEVRKVVRKCFGSDIPLCGWRLAYEALCGAGRADATHGAPGAAPCTGGLISRLARGVAERTPDLVLVFDGFGKGVASAFDPDWTASDELEDVVAQVRRFERAAPVIELVTLRRETSVSYLTAVIPVRSDTGTFAGAVLVGSVIDVALAQRFAAAIGRDVSLGLRERFLGSSVGERTGAALLEGKPDPATFDLLATETQVGTPAVLTDGLTEIGGLPIAVGVRLGDVRMVVSAPRTAVFEAASSPWPLLGLALLLALALSGWVFWERRRLDGDLERVEAAMIAVRDGALDARPPNSLRDGRAQALATTFGQTVGALLGAGADVMTRGPAVAHRALSSSLQLQCVSEPVLASALPELAGLAAVPAESYTRDLYERYRAALTAHGATLDGLTFVGFVEAVDHQEREHTQRLGGRIRFTVDASEPRPRLRPVLIDR